MKNMVILVDDNDRQQGLMDKMEAHQKGRLHRAISVFIFNSKGEMLLQQRAATKYHSAGLWTNACCSHPFPGEEVAEAAQRRLNEEMGMDVDLIPLFQFRYTAAFDNGLSENELDHVFYGISNAKPKPNPLEVQEWRYISIHSLKKEMAQRPDEFTEWFKICLDQVLESIPTDLKQAKEDK